MKAGGGEEQEGHPAQSFNPSKAPERLFAEQWVRLPPRLCPWDVGSQEARIGWAVSQTAKPDGVAGFSGRFSSGQSASWPRAFGTDSPEMHH